MTKSTCFWIRSFTLEYDFEHRFSVLATLFARFVRISLRAICLKKNLLKNFYFLQFYCLNVFDFLRFHLEYLLFWIVRSHFFSDSFLFSIVVFFFVIPSLHIQALHSLILYFLYAWQCFCWLSNTFVVEIPLLYFWIFEFLEFYVLKLSFFFIGLFWVPTIRAQRVPNTQ